MAGSHEGWGEVGCGWVGPGREGQVRNLTLPGWVQVDLGGVGVG